MSTQETTRSSFFTTLVTNRQQVAIGLGVVGVVLAGIAIWWGTWGFARSSEKADSKPTTPGEITPKELEKPAEKEKGDAKATHSPDYQIGCIWAGGVALLSLLSALWVFTQPIDAAAPEAAARKELLTFGGTAGFLTVMAGAFLGYRWHQSLVMWVGSGDTREAKWVFYAAAIFLAGLLIMFASLQLARTEQRTNAALRRVLYGFNSVFVGLLVLLVLIVINVIVFVKVPTTLVTTESAFTELNEESKKFLRSIDQPVKVYLILPESYTVPLAGEFAYTSLYTDCRGFLSQCEEQNRNFKAEYLSPSFDNVRIANLMAKLNMREGERDELGMLVTVGEDEAAYVFIPAKELLEVSRRQNGLMFTFQGENRLMTELNYLLDARSKEKVYFTKGHGELAIEPGQEPARSASEIVRYLRDRKMTVESLDLGEPDAKIPDDAAVIVVAGPRQTFPEDKVNLLRAFVRRADRPGKLLLFLPAFRGVDGKVAPSGLEGLARELGVDVDASHRIVSRPQQVQITGRLYMPQDCVLVASFPRIEGSLAKTFAKSQLIFQDAREVRPIESAPGSPRRVIPILGTGLVTWREDNYRENLLAAWAKFADDKNLRQEKQLREHAFMMAVAVLETSREGEKTIEKPRAMVFGSESILIDQPPVPNGVEEVRQQIVSDSLDWLRERQSSMGVSPKKLPVFLLEKKVEWSSQFVLLLMIGMGIAVVGGGVWLSRRR